MSDYISHDHEHDGIDRRGFLQCMAWAGTGLLWTVSGGVLASKTLAQIAKAGDSLPSATDLSFLQISDSHIGFSKEANKDVTETFKIALDRINAMPTPPSFLIHTGDITQLSKPEEFDTFDQVLKSCKTKDVFYVPGEHDVLNDGGKLYRDRYLKSVEAKGSGWYSFNKNGVHFIGLVNVLDLQAGGLGQLGGNPDCRVCPHPSLGGVSKMGLGNRRQRTRAWISETLRLGDRVKRPHPPGAPESGRQRDFPHCDVDCFPAARAGKGAKPWSFKGAL